jgi:CHASE2 domain-containing sensor protein
MFASAVGMVTNWYLASDAGIGPARVVTVGIDDEDRRSFGPPRSALDPAALIGLVETVRTLKPAVVGVDILTESKDYQRWQPGTSSAPVVWAASAQLSTTEPVGFWSWLLGGREELLVIPETVLGRRVSDDGPHWGVPLYPLDDDRVVRRLPRSWLNRDRDDMPNTNTFARAVAGEYCRTRTCHEHGHAEEVHLIYGNQPTNPLYSVRDLAECQAPSTDAGQWVACTQWMAKDNEETRKLSGAIVLLGGVYSDAEDFHPTPAGETTPGLMINAWGVRAEIEGPTLVESSRLFGLGLDILVGLLVTVFFKMPGWTLRQKTLTSFALILPAIGLSYCLFLLGWLWVTWVVMLLSSMGLNIVTENVSHDEGHSSNKPTKLRKSVSRRR